MRNELRIVSRETKNRQSELQGPTLTVFLFLKRCGSLRNLHEKPNVSRETMRENVKGSPFFHARLNLRRKASTTASVRRTLSCARVRLHAGDRAGLTSCSGSFTLQSARTRGNRLIHKLQKRASFPSLRSGRSAPIKKAKYLCRNSTPPQEIPPQPDRQYQSV